MALPAVIAGAMGRAALAGGTSGGIAGAFSGSASAGQAVGALAQSVGQLGAQSRQTTHFITGLAGVFTGKMTEAMTMWIGIVESAAEPIAKLVRVANPAQADAFGRAMADAYGVVGRMLIPVMESFTGVARKVGDLVAGLEPVFEPAIDAFSRLIDVVGDEFVKSIKENTPFFEMMADVFKTVAERAGIVVRVLGELVRVFNNLGANRIARMFGYSGGSFNPNASAVGSAARHAQFVQPKEISNELIKNSLMMGIGQKEPKDYMKSMDKTITRILTFMQNTWGQAESFGSGLKSGLIGSGAVDSETGNAMAAGLEIAGDRLQNWLATRRLPSF